MMGYLVCPVCGRLFQVPVRPDHGWDGAREEVCTTCNRTWSGRAPPEQEADNHDPTESDG